MGGKKRELTVEERLSNGDGWLYVDSSEESQRTLSRLAESRYANNINVLNLTDRESRNQRFTIPFLMVDGIVLGERGIRDYF